ncbi:MAG: alpha/beta hydrolase [Calditrichaeota bacterium]|nr:MAG: alpha/beta hydrolase [Calditrichota bacterium]
MMIHAQEGSSLAGNWQGTLKVSGMELRVVFHIREGADGAFTGTMDSPDQGAAGIPVSAVLQDGQQVTFEIEAIKGSFQGTLSQDGNRINGEWRQLGSRLPLELEKTNQPAEIKRPQEPRPPYPYRIEEITFPNEDAGIHLAGTLTLPDTSSPVPAVILVSGSGPQDRDETLMGHKPFWVLADYLTSRGIAVLRYDDRGIGQSEGDFKTATLTDFVNDVLAGLAYLRTRKEVDPDRIGVIGHSEGAWIAPEVAVKDGKVAFLVLLASPGVSGEELLLLQNRAILKASGFSDTFIDKQLRIQKKTFQVLKSAKSDSVARERIRALNRQFLESLSPEERERLEQQGSSEALLEARLPILVSPWFRQLLTYDSRPVLARVSCPILALNGSKDLQVPSRINLSNIERVLKESGHKNFVIKELPGLNHLFQHAETGLPNEYAKIEETFAPEALEEISTWILKLANEKRGQ